jgi:hypothetical protein
MSKPTLVIEYLLSKPPGAPFMDRHPGCRHAVHDKTLSVIDANGEIGGYADGVWRRWWYEIAEATEASSK